MSDLIARMERCGIPEITALCIVNDFERRGRLDSLAAYVLLSEEECHEQ